MTCLLPIKPVWVTFGLNFCLSPGKGDRGRVIDDLETEALTNGYVMSICTEDQEHKVVEAIKPILKKYGGVCIVSDAKWIVH